jgi:1,4-dihydroxy-2-naphthoate octaprenyltransferase
MMNCPEKTFALRLGYKKAMIYEIILLQLPILLMLMFLMINFAQDQRSYYPFIVMILIFPFMKLRRTIMQIKEPKLLDPS